MFNDTSDLPGSFGGLQGEVEAGKFEVWRASLRFGGDLEERVTA